RRPGRGAAGAGCPSRSGCRRGGVARGGPDQAGPGLPRTGRAGAAPQAAGAVAAPYRPGAPLNSIASVSHPEAGARAGAPTTVAPAGTSSTTTAFAPIRAPAP